MAYTKHHKPLHQNHRRTTLADDQHITVHTLILVTTQHSANTCRHSSIHVNGKTTSYCCLNINTLLIRLLLTLCFSGLRSTLSRLTPSPCTPRHFCASTTFFMSTRALVENKWSDGLFHICSTYLNSTWNLAAVWLYRMCSLRFFSERRESCDPVKVVRTCCCRVTYQDRIARMKELSPRVLV